MTAHRQARSGFIEWWGSPVTDDPVTRVRRRRHRLYQELLVRSSVALLVLGFNESNHGHLLIRLASLTALALNVPYYLAARQRWWLRGQAYTRLTLDVLLTTLGLYGAGGILAAPYLSIYMVSAIYVAFVLSGRACLVAAGLATASFLLVVLVQQIVAPVPGALSAMAPIAIFNLLLLNAVAWLTALLATAYRLTQRRLVESEECLRSIADGATDAILVTSSGDGLVVGSNRAAETMFGYAHADVRGLPLTRLIPGIEPDQFEPAARTSLETPLAATGPARDVLGVKKDGGEFPVELSVVRWTTRRGRFASWIVRDITNHKQIEELARQNAELLQAVVQGSPVAIWAHRFDGGLTIWNPAAERMFGWSASEVLGKYPPSVPEESLSESHRLFGQALGGVELMNVELQRRRKDGSSIDVSISAAPLRNTEGVVTGAVTVALDVTDRKQLEMQNRQLQKMDTLGALAGGIAHDFNNLLSIIIGRIHLLRRSVDADSPLRRHADLIHDTAERAGALTRQLLAFSRKQVFTLTTLKLTDVVHGLESILHRLVGEDLELFIGHAAEVGWVKGDRAQLEQVVMNLVVNAREAMPTGGMINIEIADASTDAVPPTERPEGWSGPCVVLTVSDTGMGMDDATRTRIFEPFFTTKDPGKGTGLGLSTVYGIVKQHGGGITVESAPDRGTTFRVYLPRVAEASTRDASRSPVKTSRPGREAVLLVEDDAEVRALAREILEMSGYTVLDAALPTTALQIAAKTRIDLVLTDIIMPQMRGVTLAERLRKIQPHISVLLMSGYPDDPARQESAEKFDCLTKPLTPEVLLDGVRSVLDRRSHRPRAGHAARRAASRAQSAPTHE